MNKNEYKNIDEYIELFPENIQKLLQEIRLTIKKAAPDSVEVISYQMPAFKQNSILVYFAAYKNHIGFYPTPSGIEAFKDKLQDYKYSKGAIQFPVNKPIPFELITKIVEFRIIEDKSKLKK
jgi:uncharacterized protein YdhG (YjbR/CyaY superfamily)